MVRYSRLVLVVLSALSVVAVTRWSASAQAAAPQVAPSGFVRVYATGASGLVDPVPLEIKKAVYTPEAMQQKIDGDIELEVTIDATGRVRDALVAKSLDNSEHGLDDAAVAAAAGWTFRPGRLNGQAVPVRTTITMTMRLH